MTAELHEPRFTLPGGVWVRVHDAGDFFSDDYTRRWLTIMRACPHVGFYAYTKGSLGSTDEISVGYSSDLR